MRRILNISWCKCPRCIATRRMRLCAVFGLFIAVAIAKVLILPHDRVLPYFVNINKASEEATKSPSSQVSLAEHPLRMIEPATPATATKWWRFVVKRDLPNARVPRELENAALAAGLVDPSKIDFISSYPASGEAKAQNDARASQQEVARGATSALKLGRLAVITPASGPASVRAEAASPSVTSPSVSGASEPNEMASVPPKRSAETGGYESMPPLASREDTSRENYGSAARGAMKKASLRKVARTVVSVLGNPSVEERKALADYPRKDNKSEPPPSQRAGDPAAPPEDLSGDLRRFVSDFLRTDQSNNVADQRRFYADSVHFYGEGDLSWTGVAAATRRYHQQEQTRRSEIAEPAATKGPVNGGFYVVEQPVVWTKTQGSQLKRGRSVLRLRVVPIDGGGWKITSIEETNR
jgi:hypothetical protein